MSESERDFEKLYREYSQPVFRYLLKLCGRRDTAEELTQETFYQAFLSLHRFRGECGVFTWLAAIGKNVFFRYLRKTKREVLSLDLVVADLTAPREEEPGWRLQRDVEISRVREAIRTLPPKYSEVLILRIYGALPYEEIAAKLGISVSSAKVIFFRAKNFIREALIDD